MAALRYDAIVIGAGIAGLWSANVLSRAGLGVLVVDRAAAGGVQTMASQGMIHGGQKYALDARDAAAGAALSALPGRWQDCLDGCGDVDLTGVALGSDDQIMWPAGGIVAGAAVFAAARAVNAGTVKMKSDEYPDAIAHLRGRRFRGAVWRLPEKVLDVRSLTQALIRPLEGRMVKGEVTALQPDGQVAVSGHALRGRMVIAAAGAGNETLLSLMKLKPETMTQRRPLRQIMVRGMPFALNGHGISASPKPRVTVTSHRGADGAYVWYLGGGVAERGATLSDVDALSFARSEMADMFPEIDFTRHAWSVLPIDRAEPLDENHRLPPGPHVHQRGQVLFAWPSKLTFAPLLGDTLLEWVRTRDIPRGWDAAPPDLPALGIGSYPWETAAWTDK